MAFIVLHAGTPLTIQPRLSEVFEELLTAQPATVGASAVLTFAEKSPGITPITSSQSAERTPRRDPLGHVGSVAGRGGVHPPGITQPTHTHTPTH